MYPLPASSTAVARCQQKSVGSTRELELCSSTAREPIIISECDVSPELREVATTGSEKQQRRRTAEEVEGEAMSPRVVQQDGFTVIGITARTTNAKEMTPDGVIGKQWMRIFQEGLIAKIPNKADASIIAVYIPVVLCGAPGVRTKPSPRRRRGLDASTDRGLTERSGEVFLLDILSHRMSVIEMLQQLRAALRCGSWRSPHIKT